MSGEYIYLVDRTPPHKCELPDKHSDPEPMTGDLWQCECGLVYEARWAFYDIDAALVWRRKRLLWGRRPKKEFSGG